MMEGNEGTVMEESEGTDEASASSSELHFDPDEAGDSAAADEVSQSRREPVNGVDSAMVHDSDGKLGTRADGDPGAASRRWVGEAVVDRVRPRQDRLDETTQKDKSLEQQLFQQHKPPPLEQRQGSYRDEERKWLREHEYGVVGEGGEEKRYYEADGKTGQAKAGGEEGAGESTSAGRGDTTGLLVNAPDGGGGDGNDGDNGIVDGARNETESLVAAKVRSVCVLVYH